MKLRETAAKPFAGGLWLVRRSLAPQGLSWSQSEVGDRYLVPGINLGGKMNPCKGACCGHIAQIHAGVGAVWGVAQHGSVHGPVTERARGWGTKCERGR